MEELYKVFRIPKKSGGVRIIEAPNAELKEKQRNILQKWQFKLPISPYCHAFRCDHSIVTACGGHIGAPYMVRFDLSNFFPSIKLVNFERVLEREIMYQVRRRDPPINWYRGGWSKTQKYIRDVLLELRPCFHDFNDDQGMRLPQGAPTSPWLSNVFLTRFDYMMAFSCRDAGMRTGSAINYSRYADDICISGSDEKLLWALYFKAVKTLGGLGLSVNPKKTHMFLPHQRHMCVGLVVNKRPQPKRRWRKNLRAEIHNQVVAGKPLKKSTLGKINFLNMCRKQETRIGSYAEIMGRMEDVVE